LLGFGCAFAVTHLIESYLYGVSPTDPLSFAIVGLVLVGATLLACWFPALRAARIDPIQALREE
jgi:putative ABC transport system permease protein